MGWRALGAWLLVFLWSLELGPWCFSAFAQTLALPPRPANAITGTQFIQKITPLDPRRRESEIFTQIASGNVPNFLRKLCLVTVTNISNEGTNRATFSVTPDYLAVGSDDDYFLTPMSPNTAQKIADLAACSLPTRKMVNDIYAAAAVRLTPSPIPPSPAMTTVPVFSNHNAIVRAQRREYLKEFPLGALVAGDKKDVVIADSLSLAPGKVAIYGWHRTNGVPIQPLYLGHSTTWVDYSQCVRLVQNSLVLNGTNTSISEVLADVELCALLSDEGRITDLRYPTNDLPLQPAKLKSNVITNRPGLANFTGFHDGSAFNERIASFTMDPQIRGQINSSATVSLNSSNTLLLVLYALPNGCTIEQTIGKTIQSTNDWRYDIQHIGAQTRFLRSALPQEQLVLVYLENELKSWPAWGRKYGNDLIPEIIASVKKLFATNKVEIALDGHSGGGSFIFGYLNAIEKIPDDIVRIAFLDSCYAYDRALGHNEKFVRWLKARPNHFLCVLAYNDAAALLDGKPFVSAAGGTWGKSHRMLNDLGEAFRFTSRTNGNFEASSALDGRIQFILRDNPERKIYHTVVVERNGFIHSMVSGTTNESRGYEYFGERSYSKWIETSSNP